MKQLVALDNDTKPITVSQLNRQVRFWLEHDVGMINVVGELSNLSKPVSGHLYFTLKDQSAQLRCVYFRNYHQYSPCDNNQIITDGQQVIAKGKLSLYEARGDYQLIVQELVQAGLGELYQQFEYLKLKLEQQGLFAQHRKKMLPHFPTVIAIITSESGAALHDMLTTLVCRFPIADVRVYPCEVQGRGACAQLIRAIKEVNSNNQSDILRTKSDVILLARGGGSIEDLWPFNDEQLALAISRSSIPVVSGIGHETDFTIADFVADLRAATPTAAAIAATPDKIELISVLDTIIKRMIAATTRYIQHQKLLLTHEIANISSPKQLITNHWQSIDYMEYRLNQQLRLLLRDNHQRLQTSLIILQAHHPKALLQNSLVCLKHIQQRLHDSIRIRLVALEDRFAKQIAILHALSPLATLDRGYAIATINDRIIFSCEQVKLGDVITLRLAKGNNLKCRVL